MPRFSARKIKRSIAVENIHGVLRVRKTHVMNFVSDERRSKKEKAIDDKSAQVVEKRMVAAMKGVKNAKEEKVVKGTVRGMKKGENGIVNAIEEEW